MIVRLLLSISFFAYSTLATGRSIENFPKTITGRRNFFTHNGHDTNLLSSTTNKDVEESGEGSAGSLTNSFTTIQPSSSLSVRNDRFTEDGGWIKLSSGTYAASSALNSDVEVLRFSPSGSRPPSRRSGRSGLWDYLRTSTPNSNVGDVIDKNNLAILPAGCRRTQTMAFTMPRGGAGDVTGDTDLLMFTGDNCDHCDQMEPYLRRLEKELGVRVHRFNVWKDQVNFKLFEKLDKGQKCGGLPYFYNVKTQQCVCGATTFGNLRAWAKGKPCNMFYYVPEKRAEDSEEKISKRGVGLLGRFSSKIGEMKEEGVGKVKERVEEEVRSRKGTDKVEKEVEKSEAKEEIVKN